MRLLLRGQYPQTSGPGALEVLSAARLLGRSGGLSVYTYNPYEPHSNPSYPNDQPIY